jgi:hypothetical protein
MDIQVREARPADMDFARALYFETMRGMIEPLFGVGSTPPRRDLRGVVRPPAGRHHHG